MITSSEVSKYLYRILNQNSLTGLISGKIYREQKPTNSELQDIVINTIFLKSGHYSDIQNGKANINIYTKSLNGLHDLENLTSITNVVLDLLENNTQSNNAFYYQIIDTNLIKDLQQNSMYYNNIILNIQKY